MRVAILGSTGQLGADFIRCLGGGDGWEAIPLSHDDVDITKPDQAIGALARLRPDVVVNCAGIVNVDACEDRPDDAFAVNATGAFHVARACADIGATCVYVSTDFVFDGNATAPYAETDEPRPCNVYGISKLAGEHLVRAAAPAHYIVRVAGLFGVAGTRTKKANFIDTVIAKVTQGESLRVVSDIHMSPTYTVDVVAKCRDLIEAGAPFGIYHVTNSGYCSWHALTEATFHLLGRDVKVTPIMHSDYTTKVRRPAFSALASPGLAAAGLTPLRPWQDALAAYLREKGYLSPSADRTAATAAT